MCAHMRIFDYVDDKIAGHIYLVNISIALRILSAICDEQHAKGVTQLAKAAD